MYGMSASAIQQPYAIEPSALFQEMRVALRRQRAQHAVIYGTAAVRLREGGREEKRIGRWLLRKIGIRYSRAGEAGSRD